MFILFRIALLFAIMTTSSLTLSFATEMDGSSAKLFLSGKTFDCAPTKDQGKPRTKRVHVEIKDQDILVTYEFVNTSPATEKRLINPTFTNVGQGMWGFSTIDHSKQEVVSLTVYNPSNEGMAVTLTTILMGQKKQRTLFACASLKK